MPDGMTAQDWAQLLPGPPQSAYATHSDRHRAIEHLRFADVVSAVVLPVPWSGMVEPEEGIKKQIITRVGRWCVTTQGLFCLGEEYWLATDRLDEDGWLPHLFEKDWLFDPSDLLLAFEQAGEHLLPDEDRAQRSAAIDTEIRQAITSGHVIFDPAVLRGNHTYLVQRMQPEEHAAFCAFLADEGFMPRSWSFL